jgi:hypothetical protein
MRANSSEVSGSKGEAKEKGVSEVTEKRLQTRTMCGGGVLVWVGVRCATNSWEMVNSLSSEEVG